MAPTSPSESKCAIDPLNEEQTESRASKRHRLIGTSAATPSGSFASDQLDQRSSEDNENLVPTATYEEGAETVDYESFRTIYNTYQLIFVPRATKKGFVHNKRAGSLDQRREAASPTHKRDTFNWRDVRDLFASLNKEDKSSWCVENTNFVPSLSTKTGEVPTTVATTPETVKPSDFLSPDWSPSMTVDDSAANPDNVARKGYCSFIVQKDRKAYQDSLTRLPVVELPVALPIVKKEKKNDAEVDAHADKLLRHSSCVWFFYGWNDPQQSSLSQLRTIASPPPPLEGRPEHTDSVLHDGTWHFQLSGVKTWCLRPTEALIKRAKSETLSSSQRASNAYEHLLRWSEKGSELRVSCREGDLIFLNTRLWWHRTVLPVQPCDNKTETDESFHKNLVGNEGIVVPSVSYARDVYLPRSFWTFPMSGDHDEKYDTSRTAMSAVERRRDDDDAVEAMTNLDGLYARNDIDKDTIIFTENDMPDCELHRSDDPNCELVVLEDGTSAIVSMVNIKCGDFFTVAESDNEEDDSEEEK